MQKHHLRRLFIYLIAELWIGLIVLQPTHGDDIAAKRQDRVLSELAAAERLVTQNPNFARAYLQRGMANFAAGNIEASIDDFDKCIELTPSMKPELWQRGISLYYAKKFIEGVEQFEVHHTVNPDDVENSVWHFLCLAKIEGIDKAREKLIDSRGDSRWPMMPILKMFRAEMTADEVLKSVNQPSVPSHGSATAKFYAHLYVGLFHEANDRSDEAAKHLQLAVEQKTGGYMADVAFVDLHIRELASLAASKETQLDND